MDTSELSDDTSKSIFEGTSSSDSINSSIYKSDEPPEPNDTTKEDTPPDERKKLTCILIGGVLACFVVLMFIVIVGCVVMYISLYRDREEGNHIDENSFENGIRVPKGMKLMKFNHLTYQSETKYLKSIESNYIVLEEHKDPSKYSISLKDEVYYLSEEEEEISVICNFLCHCTATTELPERRDLVFDRWFAYKAIIGVIGIGILILEKMGHLDTLEPKYKKECEDECEEMAMEKIEEGELSEGTVVEGKLEDVEDCVVVDDTNIPPTQGDDEEESRQFETY